MNTNNQFVKIQAVLNIIDKYEDNEEISHQAALNMAHEILEEVSPDKYHKPQY